MSFERVPFKLTAYGAERASNLMMLSKADLGVYTTIYMEERAATVAPFYRAMKADVNGPSYGTRISLPLLDTLNVLKRTIPGTGLEISFRGEWSLLKMNGTRYPISVEVGQCQQQGRDTTLFKFSESRRISDFASFDVAMKRERDVLKAEMFDHPGVRALITTRVMNVPRGFDLHKVMQQNNDLIEDQDTGLTFRRLHKGSDQMMIELNGLLLGHGKMSQGHLSERHVSSILGTSITQGSVMASAARNILIKHFMPPEQVAAARAARKPEDEKAQMDAWSKNLDEAVRTTDLGYA